MSRLGEVAAASPDSTASSLRYESRLLPPTMMRQIPGKFYIFLIVLSFYEDEDSFFIWQSVGFNWEGIGSFPLRIDLLINADSYSRYSSVLSLLNHVDFLISCE
jgi:hypothetical protein